MYRERPSATLQRPLAAASVSLAGALRIEQRHADFIRDLVKFFVGDGFEGFVATFQFLVHLYGFLLHHAVGFLAAADELEIVAGSDAGMAVLGVEAEAQEPGFLLRLRRFALL